MIRLAFLLYGLLRIVGHQDGLRVAVGLFRLLREFHYFVGEEVSLSLLCVL